MTPADPTGQQRRPPADLTTTHTLDIGPTTVVKRYRSWDRDEPRREWQTLTLLARHAPGLAPRPLDRSAHPPAVTMERVPGTPLRGTHVGPAQTTALAAALTRLHEAVPRTQLDALPPRLWPPALILRGVRDQCAQPSPTAPDTDPTEQAALSAGTAWISAPHLDTLAATEPTTPVLGFADGNLANYLWDGTRIRLVDFESAGRADRIHELAEITEHISAWSDSELDTDTLLGHFTLTLAETRRLRELRRLTALMWLCMLTLDRATAHPRNPPGTVTRQARRLLHLLN
ncbi:aminoglycoside phosphotransferase family protein [Streptomyces sp. NBC_01267]|uniref:phosphotransferase n=1 Tax=unclassified Streptomyces TaxID=2593676 RepID=UPI002E2EC3AD|nr:phosphotransferase [Streptomyces sp. NBC_01267]